MTRNLSITIFCIFLFACFSKPEMMQEQGSTQVGYASWYGDQFHGQKTASGEIYDMYQMTAAHRFFAFGTIVRVIKLDDQQSVVVRVNDRGPFVKGRIIDLSYAAAKELGLVNSGTTKVRLEVTGKQPIFSFIYIQIGSFQSLENAKVFLEGVEDRFPDYSTKIDQTSKFHRVWVGPFTNEDRALEVQRNLESKGYDSLLLHQ